MKNTLDSTSEVEIQRRYYAETANKYDSLHVHEKDNHYFALCVMMGAIEFLDIESMLEVGSGTGRSMLRVKQQCPNLIVRGIEPVRELREIAYAKGISPEALTEGDALQLHFEDGQFDLVCAFGVLHHIRTPEVAIQEMLRVAKKGIFISDSNNFGQGHFLSRTIKQALNSMGLWPVADWIKTKGRGYTISEGDGLAYSYSIFNNYRQIYQSCKSVHLLNTSPGGINLYKTSDNLALLGIKN
ncbi:class I SAM-dependent methyltransferase [Moorena producens]|uniref:class I SAM-dependent methyltransferase n=1 Tax=Moorena producens TaxID=1155739 RepID=UPI003C785179